MLDLTPIFARFPILETERCILRRPDPDQAEPFFRLWSSAEVARYLGRPPFTTMDEVSQRLEEFRERFEMQTSITWAITDRATGALIGTAMLLHILPLHHRAELGYDLLPDWWGKGLITEAAAAVLDFGFGTMGLHSVEANTDGENIASQRVLEKLGFVREGHLRENFYEPAVGRFTDTTVFGLLAAGWQVRKGKG